MVVPGVGRSKAGSLLQGVGHPRAPDTAGEGQGLAAQKWPLHCGLAPKVATVDIFPASLAWVCPYLSPLLVPVPLSSSSQPRGPQTGGMATEPVRVISAISPE